VAAQHHAASPKSLTSVLEAEFDDDQFRSAGSREVNLIKTLDETLSNRLDG
jgi:hypothetical protein